MKISKIEIKDFHQFKDFSLDLTYPKGHEKEGKPLDKVCFIGQSGTGKTTLLELIPHYWYNYNTSLIKKIGGRKKIEDKIRLTYKYGHNSEFELIRGHILDGKYLFHALFPDEWQAISSKLIYFPANLNYDLKIEDKNTLDENAIIDFSKEKVANVWHLILDKIQKYQEQELVIRQEISKTVEQSSNNLETIKKALKKLEDWKKTEFNPIEDVANNCLNPLLAAFKLRVKTELDIKSKDDIGFIKIEDFSGNEIPNGLWSTGTKQVILSALPLYLLKPKHTVILCDEPERSLYPDLQHFVVDFYSSLTENCQFFYSTHSPIIASSFEPWEIVELKFNDEGKIFQELYYKGERHIDNYKIYPEYLGVDSILKKVFDVNVINPKQSQKMSELAELGVQLRYLKEQKNVSKDELKAVWDKYVALAEKLDWDYSTL